MTQPVREHMTPVSGGLSLSGVAKTFKTPAGPVEAVRDVDLHVSPGETVALLGPNGAGKSTTIDMILGLTDPDKGSIEVFGMTPRKAIDAGAVGGMLQIGAVIKDLSVREILDMTISLYPNPLSVDEVVALTGIQDLLQRKTTKLSGGQTQRLRAALALCGNPDLLLLDEPTVALDVEARREFWNTVRDFAARGKTVIFATHYLEEADEFADRIVLMSRGRIVADGPANQIKAAVDVKHVTATVPDADPQALRALPGVSDLEIRGQTYVLACTDSDSALRALLTNYPQARDILVSGAGLEAAFMRLTSEDPASSGTEGSDSK